MYFKPMEAKTEVVTATVLAYLKQHCGYDSSVAVEAPAEIITKSWSIVYIIPLLERDKRYKIVVKISRSPEQERPEESWEEAHLVDRGIREYDGLVRIYNHFQEQPDSMLQAVRPIAFIRDINAIVMDFIDGSSFYDTCLRPKAILTPGGKERAERLTYRTGEWLRTFHALSQSVPTVPDDPQRVFSPALAWRQLLEAVERLQERDVDPTRWHIWSAVENALKPLDSDERVWIHNDFHMGNAMVLAEDRILSFDTGLDKLDHPYSDVGKFLADIQSRGSRTMSFGMIPPSTTVEALRQGFLEGYLKGQTLNRPLLALYEGLYLFEKWEESLIAMDNKAPGKKLPVPMRRMVNNTVLNPTFKRIIHHWAKRDLNL